MAKSNNRKFDRHRKRSPAAARYRGEDRETRNKRRKIQRAHRFDHKELAVQRGTARARRRAIDKEITNEGN